MGGGGGDWMCERCVLKDAVDCELNYHMPKDYVIICEERVEEV